MALAVASTSSVATSNADNLVITKPSGVQSGDLLVICAMGEHDGNAGFVSEIASSGFTKQLAPAGPNNNGATDQNRGAVFLWRIADSTDVSASNYTISLNGSETLGIAAMFRITGWTTGNPIFSSATALDKSASSLNLVRPTENLLIMLNGIKQDDLRYSFSAPSITASSGNPSWTEVVDSWVTVNGGPDPRSISCAVYYANDTNTTNVTAYGVTATGIGGSGGSESGVSFLAVLCEPQNATGDVSHINITPAIEGVTASQVNIGAEVSHQAITPTINGIGTQNSSDRTQWQNESKPSTSWQNETL
jgi:hypothetical protein